MKLYTFDNQFIKEFKNVPRDFTGIGIAVTGTKYWYSNGLLHIIGGPAAEWYDGTKHWYLNGELHRIDGPACEYSNGFKRWFVNGKNVSQKEHTLYVDILKLKKLI